MSAPYFGTYQRLHLHVSATPREVIRAARRKLAPAGKSRDQREARHLFLRAMLDHHANWRRLVNTIR